MAFRVRPLARPAGSRKLPVPEMDLSKFVRKHWRFFMWPSVTLGRVLTDFLCSTLRIEVYNADYVLDRLFHKREQVILSFWHNRILVLTYALGRALHMNGCPLAVIVSKSRDGEFIKQVAEYFGGEYIRGSTSKNAPGALMGMLRAARKGRTLVFTPDGPRGPKYEFQPGGILAASRTGYPIIPVAYAAKRAWRAPSWDRFVVPFPFTRCRIVFGEPVFIPRKLDDEGIEKYTSTCTEAMMSALREAERLA